MEDALSKGYNMHVCTVYAYVPTHLISSISYILVSYVIAKMPMLLEPPQPNMTFNFFGHHHFHLQMVYHKMADRLTCTYLGIRRYSFRMILDQQKHCKMPLGT